MGAAASFDAVTGEVGDVERALAAAARDVNRPTAGFVFLSGALGGAIDDVARAVSRAWRGVPVTIATGAGVLGDRGEHEGESAASGVLVSGGDAVPIAVATGKDELPTQVAADVFRAASGRPATAVVFASSRGFSPETLDALGASAPDVRVLGAGTAGDRGALVVDAEGRIRDGALVGLVLRGGARPIVGISPAARVLGAPSVASDTRGAMILRLDDDPALDVLSKRAHGLPSRTLVLALVPDDGVTEDAFRAAPLRTGRLRPIRGVDPSRRSILLGDQVPERSLVAFAALDPGAARGDLETIGRELARDAAGAAGRFGLFLSCAGRGSSLYGTKDVETKILRARFPRLPFAGMLSAFEIAPGPRKPTLHFYTGVFGLFTAPS